MLYIENCCRWKRSTKRSTISLRSATVWPQQTWSEIDMGRKVEGYSSPFHGSAGFPSNTMSPGTRPTSVPSGNLIHPIVCPQYINVSDRQDNGPIAYGELVTVAQK